MAKHLYRTMTPDEVNEAVLAGRVISIPVGQLETHGPHLPIDVDVVQVQNVVDEAAARAPDVFAAAPPIYYGFSEHVMDFPGTMNIRPEIMMSICSTFAGVLPVRDSSDRARQRTREQPTDLRDCHAPRDQ